MKKKNVYRGYTPINKNHSDLVSYLKERKIFFTNKVIEENQNWFDLHWNDMKNIDSIINRRESNKKIQERLDIYCQSKIHLKPSDNKFVFSKTMQNLSNFLDVNFLEKNFSSINLHNFKTKNFEEKLFLKQINDLITIKKDRDSTLGISLVILIKEAIFKNFKDNDVRSEREETLSLNSDYNYEDKTFSCTRVAFVTDMVKELSLYYKKASNFVMLKQQFSDLNIENSSYEELIPFLKQEFIDDFGNRENKSLSFKEYKKKRFTINRASLITFFVNVVIETKLLTEKIVQEKKDYKKNSKSVSYFVIKSSELNDLDANFAKTSTLPRVYPLEDWKVPLESHEFTEEEIFNNVEALLEDQTFSGAVNNNKYVSMLFINQKNEKSHSIISKSCLESINYQQKIGFKINQRFLYHITQSMPTFLHSYVLMNPDKQSLDTISDILIFSDELKSVEIQSCSEVLEKILANKKKDFIQKNGSEEKWQDEEWRLKKETMLCYSSVFSLIKNFLGTYLLAEIYKNKECFFIWTADFRFREYARGFLLFPHGTKFAKSLLDFSRESEEVSYNLDLYKNYITKLAQSSKYKDSFAIGRQLLLDIPITVVGLDAVASGLSISSGVSGDGQGMIDTNVVRRLHESDNGEAKDPYSFVMKKSLILLKDRLSKEFPEIEIDNIIQEENPEIETDNTVQEEIINIIKSVYRFFNRSNIKGWLMRYNYSETYYARIMNMLEFLKKDLKIEVSNKKLAEFAIISEKSFIDSLKGTYKNQSLFTETMTAIFKDNWDKNTLLSVCKKGNDADIVEYLMESYKALLKKSPYKKAYEEALATLIKLNSTRPTYLYLILGSLKRGQMSIVHMGKRKGVQNSLKNKSSIVLNQLTDEPDLDKMIRSAMAHFIHFHDALILQEVVLSCKKNNISLYTAHDAYYVHVDYASLVKKYYFDAYMKIIFGEDTIEEFLTANNFYVSKENRINLDKIKDFRKIIRQEYERGNLVMSNHILTI